MIELTKGEVHHFITVLRKGKGDIIRLNRDGDTIEAEIIGTGRNISVEVRNIISTPVKPQIRLYQAVIKKQNLELLIRFAAQLAVESVTFMVTRYSIVKELNIKYMQRLRKIAAENAVLSNNRIPELKGAVSYKEAVIESEKRRDFRLLFTAAGKSVPVAEILPDNMPERISVYIGPEGGFDEDELTAASESGIKKAYLGPYRLRSETAAICAISGIRTMYEKK
jgi:16S rRNA (uracil1498-N3)-methyltransferase